MKYKKSLITRNIVTDIILIAIFCSIFTYWFFRDLDKQGVYCDVALFGNAALSVKNNLPDCYCSVSVDIFGKKIPLMLNRYTAATDIYATLPWVYLFGNKPIALYMPSFIYGFLASVLLYFLCLRVYHNRIYSALASLILVTYPPFIIAGRLGLFMGISAIFFALASILSLYLWQEKKGKLWLFLMGLSMGAGLAGRIQFLWVINAIFIYIFLIKSLRNKFFIPKNIITCLIGVTIGAFSLILGNLSGNFLTLRFFSKYAFISGTGLSNLNYPVNFLERAKEAISLVNSTGLSSAATHPNHMGIYLFIAGVIFIILGGFYRYVKNQRIASNNQLLPFFIFIFVFIQSPFTPSLFDTHHIIVLLPFMCMIYSMPLYTLLESIKNNRKSVKMTFRSPGRLLQFSVGSAVLIMIALFISHNYKLLAIDKVYRNIHSGVELKWNVMSDVLHFLDTRGIKNVGLGDTGLMDTILFLSNFSLSANEVFYAPYKDIPKNEQEESLRARFNNEKEGYYLFRIEEGSWIHFFSDFRRIAADCNKKVELFHEFKTPENISVYKIYKVW